MPDPAKEPTDEKEQSYEAQNPETGETKTVTLREWRDQKLGQQGWVKVSPDFPPDN